MFHEIAASDREITTIVSPLQKLFRKIELVIGDVTRLVLHALLDQVAWGRGPGQTFLT